MARNKATGKRPRIQKQVPKVSPSEQYSQIVDLWVKEPPSGTFPIEDLHRLPSPYTTEMDEEIPIETRIVLIAKRSEFERSRNPLAAIFAFRIAREARLFPPMWVLDWLGKAFERYESSEGTQSLEKILGLVPGRGQSHLFKTMLAERRDEMIALDVWRVMLLFNTSLETASLMVSRRLEETPDWNESLHALHLLSQKTIADRYKKKWKKMFDRPDMRHRFLRDWTKSKADEYLKTFPPDSYKPEDINPTITT